MVVELCRNNVTGLRQNKMPHEEEMSRHTKICRNKSKQEFTKVYRDNCFMSRQNLLRSAIHGKEIMSRHLKLGRDNYEMESVELYCDNSKFFSRHNLRRRQRTLSRQSLKRNVSHKCCDKSITKDEDIEAAYMSRHS